MASSGTGLPLPCSSDPSALCSGRPDGPAARAHLPSQIPKLRCPARTLGSLPRVRELGEVPARVGAWEPRQSRAGAGSSRTWGPGRGLCLRLQRSARARPELPLGARRCPLQSLQQHSPMAPQFPGRSPPLHAPGDTPGAARLARTSPLGSCSAPGFRSLLGPRERADHAARRFYARRGRRPPHGPLLSSGAEPSAPRGRQGALRQSLHSP